MRNLLFLSYISCHISSVQGDCHTLKEHRFNLAQIFISYIFSIWYTDILVCHQEPLMDVTSTYKVQIRFRSSLSFMRQPFYFRTLIFTKNILKYLLKAHIYKLQMSWSKQTKQLNSWISHDMEPYVVESHIHYCHRQSREKITVKWSK